MEMLQAKLRPYFDGKFNPDKAIDLRDTRKIEKEFTTFLRQNCRSAFPTESAYTAFEEEVYAFCGRLQITAMEAAFEKGVACGMYLKEKEDTM